MATRQPEREPERASGGGVPAIVWLLIGLIAGIAFALLFLPIF